MTIISFAFLRVRRLFVFGLFLSVFCLIPFQKPIKGVIGRFAKSLTPTDLSLPGYFSTAIPFYLSDCLILLFVMVLFLFSYTRIKQLFWSIPTRYLSLWLIVGVLSILFSKTANYPLQYIHLIHLGFYFVLFGSILAIGPLFELKTLVQGFAYVWVAVGVIEAAMAIIQYTSQTPLGLSMMGEFHLSHFPFGPEGTSLYLGNAPQGNILMRASGTFSHPNILGCFLLTAILSSLYLRMTRGKSLLLSLAIIFQGAALCTTFSRSAFLALVVSLSCFYGLLFFQRKINCKQLLKSTLTVGLCAAALLIAFFPAIRSRGGVINYGGLVKAADQERVYYNQIAFNLWQASPWVGVGYNNFQLYAPYTSEEMPGYYFHSKVHNIYLLSLSETGGLGFACFICFLFSVIHPLRRMTWNSEKIFLFSLFSGLLLIGGCDFFLLYGSAGPLLFFSVAALLFLTKRESPDLKI